MYTSCLSYQDGKGSGGGGGGGVPCEKPMHKSNSIGYFLDTGQDLLQYSASTEPGIVNRNNIFS